MRAGRRCGAALTVVALVGCVAFAAASAGARAATRAARSSAATALPAETISPLVGTIDANPQTQISFLGVPASALHDIVVRGSRTGRHHGALKAYSTGTGGSFVPSRPFVGGEKVTVSATIVNDGQRQHVGTQFYVAEPYVLPQSSPSAPLPETATNVQRFQSRPDLVAPAVSVTVPATNPALGDIFLAPTSGPGESGPMIVNPSGQLVWFHPISRPSRAFDFNVQTYEGKPVLTWWQGRTIELHGQGVDEIYSASYTPIARVYAGNGLQADLHEFQITPQDTAFITAYAPIHWNLSSNGGPRKGLLDDGVVQEIDIKTGLVMWQWNALAHVPISATYMPVPQSSDSSEVLDYFHINSIDPLSNGDLLISSRNTWASYLLDRSNGDIIWQVGGKHSTFALGPGVRFAWQHDVLVLPDATPGQYEISMFDNEDSPREATQSRALEIVLNTANNTATLTRQIEFPGHPILSDSQGDVQQLSNGDVFVGWGQVGVESEFNAAGQLTFAMTLTASTSSFRGYRYVWSATPVVPPAVAVTNGAGGQTEFYASWNGATGVTSWTVLAGGSPTTLGAIGNFPSTGFETAIAAPTSGPYVRLQAIGSAGQVLAQSRIVKLH